MRLYVFEQVLADYTGGMALVSAESLERAQELAFERFECDEGSVAEWLAKDSNEGWRYPVHVYELAGDEVDEGVQEHVYGGG